MKATTDYVLEYFRKEPRGAVSKSEIHRGLVKMGFKSSRSATNQAVSILVKYDSLEEIRLRNYSIVFKSAKLDYDAKGAKERRKETREILFNRGVEDDRNKVVCSKW